ncbi:AsmA-like C-terminal region-containing protein, partial [Sphingomonas sp. Root1294]|uniref:AsmA family protein n=1 Tax=Sphingomonas sp. Root1294 TaxID=1736447 RepID=UPI00138F1A65
GRWLLLAAGVLALLALLVAAFPWGLLREPAERALSKHFGRTVTIGTLRRIDRFSFAPVIEVRDLRVPQAAWAGRGDLARVDRLVVTVPLAGLLRRGFHAHSVRIDGMSLDLVRTADGRENWRAAGEAGSGGRPPSIDGLSIANGRISYRDARRRRTMAATIVAGPKGMTIEGRGDVLGAPVSIGVRAAPVGGTGRWPFRVMIDGKAMTMALDGAMARPLDVGHLDMDVRARANNLSYVDAVVEAGLPRTQPVDLRAHARRDGNDWTVTRLKGTVGRSDIAGEATIRKRAGRHVIDGTVRARRFDFDDLSDARSRSIAMEKRWRFGPRVFPDTAIDLDNVRRTDGTLRVHAERLLWPGPSPFRSLDGTIRLDHGLLTVDDLRLGLTHGTMAGKLRIEQRDGDGPVLSLDLMLRNGRIVDFAPDTRIDGGLTGRMRLTGPGDTVRAAIGRSSGMIGIVGQGGTLPVRTAALLGQDLLGGVFGSRSELARLRCAAIRLDASGGVATVDPMIVDTSRARTEMTGRIMLAEERLALEMRGTPKQGAGLRLVGPVLITGTLKEPDVALPGKGGVVGKLFKSIGRAIDGEKEPVATDADCAGLAARALADR